MEASEVEISSYINFKDIMPNSVVSVAASFLPAYFPIHDLFCGWYILVIVVVDHFLILQPRNSIYHWIDYYQV